MVKGTYTFYQLDPNRRGQHASNALPNQAFSFCFCFCFFFGVVVRYKRLEPKVPGSSPTQYLVFFPFVLL